MPQESASPAAPEGSPSRGTTARKSARRRHGRSQDASSSSEARRAKSRVFHGACGAGGRGSDRSRLALSDAEHGSRPARHGWPARGLPSGEHDRRRLLRSCAGDLFGHGERDNPESRVGGPTNRRQNLLEDSFVSQGRKPAVCSQRHVNRIAALVLPPAPMRNRWSTPHDRRSPGPLTNTSSRTWEEQVELTRTQTHFEKGDSLSAGSPGGCAGARVAPVGLGTDSERANARARASESPRSPGGRPRGPRPSSPTCR